MVDNEIQELLSIDDAVRKLRGSPEHGDLVRDTYLGRDVRASAERFASSSEFRAVRALLDPRLQGALVVDVGAGTGIASYAMLTAGAAQVLALEPGSSDEVGRGAMARLDAGPRLQILDAWGEANGLATESADIVYTRQTLHHAGDLPQMLRECARVLKPGGLFLACREHVVDNEAQLRAFLGAHPIHQLAGGENAFDLGSYLRAIREAGLTIERVFGPWDSIINAFPIVTDEVGLKTLPRVLLQRRFGRLGLITGLVPPVRWAVWARLRRPAPGRLYSFLASKPLSATS